MSKKLEYDEVRWGDLLKNNDKINFIVSNKQYEKILKETGNKVDKDGFIRDSTTKDRVESKDGDDIKLKELGGILTGSKVFVKKNIASFSEHLIEKKIRNSE